MEKTPRDLSSYLRLTRPARGAWWRLLLGVVVGTVGFFVVTLVALLAVIACWRIAGQTLHVNGNRITPGLLLATNLGLAACIPLAWLLTRVIYGIRPRWLGSVAPGIRWRWLLVCIAVTSVVWGALFVLELLGVAASSTHTFGVKAVEAIAVILLTQPLQAAGEEYLFRGFLLQSLGATGLPAPVCWVLSGAAFATAHAQFAPPLFADRFLIGVVFAWLAGATGGIEASISIHAIKNITVLIPAALLGQLSGSLQPTDVTWVPFGLDAVMLAIVVLWIRARARRQVLPPPPPEASPIGLPAG